MSLRNLKIGETKNVYAAVTHQELLEKQAGLQVLRRMTEFKDKNLPEDVMSLIKEAGKLYKAHEKDFEKLKESFNKGGTPSKEIAVWVKNVITFIRNNIDPKTKINFDVKYFNKFEPSGGWRDALKSAAIVNITGAKPYSYIFAAVMDSSTGKPQEYSLVFENGESHFDDKKTFDTSVGKRDKPEFNEARVLELLHEHGYKASLSKDEAKKVGDNKEKSALLDKIPEIVKSTISYLSRKYGADAELDKHHTQRNGNNFEFLYHSYRGGGFYEPREGEEDDDWPRFAKEDEIEKALQEALPKGCSVSLQDHEKGMFSVNVSMKK